MKKWAVFLFCFFVCCAHEIEEKNQCPNYFMVHEPFKILGYQNREEFERRIVFLEDSKNQKFVLKCYGDDQKEEAIGEYLGSCMGVTADIPVHRVRLIVEDPLLTEINNGTILATLHERVPGQRLGKWFESAAHDIALKGGLISERHLNSIAISDDLCDIVALDIFLNNKDRHNENCFYDEITSHYYGIDMGDVFLSTRAITNDNQSVDAGTYEIILQNVVQEQVVALENYYFLHTLDPSSISIHQKKALMRVSMTLKKLLSFYSPQAIIRMWLEISDQVGYAYGEYKKIYLTALIKQNIYWVEKVVEKIEEIMRRNVSFFGQKELYLIYFH